MNTAAKIRIEDEADVVNSAPPLGKYSAYEDRFDVDLPDRTWPNRRIRKAPAWCSVDLRDGNQSIPSPMNVEQKINFFSLLTSIGFKEIEIGYPAASLAERQFTRALIERNLIPDDVTPQVLIAAREDLIRETFACLAGIRRAIIHIYTPTSVAQREQVFKMTTAQVIASAVHGTKVVRELADSSDIDVTFQFSPESFTGTEREFSRDICNAVIAVWNPRPDEKMIINLPSTVEHSMPNRYADLIEWMNRSLIRRENVTLSIHPHNDRGTAIAASEMALLAGAERVEGTLFGNGERAGNVDLVTMALNMYGQGLDPRLCFHNLPHIRDVYERCFGLRVPERHPYAGDLAVVAFSGAHQAAIRKGIEHRERLRSSSWDIPYIPVDFKDFGRSYTPIMVNAQSGKNGAAFILDREFGCRLPTQMESVFAHEVQAWCDAHGVVMPPGKLWEVFESTFVRPKGAIALKGFTATEVGDGTKASLELKIGDDRVVRVHGFGNGPIDAATKALKEIGRNVSIRHYSGHSRGEGSDAEAVAYLQVEWDGVATFGVGIDQNSQTASIQALIAGVNRLELGRA
jgi:2-isopropylmalate synthase